MNYEQFDRQVRDTAMQKAFPVEQDTPDRLRQLLEQLGGRQAESDATRPGRKG